ncbi:MAG: P-type conjugative transfer protein TrbJ, partial [Ferrovum sp.]|nr:P-type conjugative transfer protein TrbJ [Ferrovum sp.]
MMKKTAIALCISLGSVGASAGTFTGGATFPEQIVQEITAVQQYSQLAMQLQQQLMMVQNQVRNLQSFPGQLWQSTLPTLNNLVNLVGNAQGLNYATQNTVAAVQQQYGDPTQAMTDYQTRLQQWTTDTNTSIENALSANQVGLTDLASVEAAKQQILDQSNTATGRMQVLQAGNQISGVMVSQLQNLQATIMSGNSMLSQYVGNQQNAQDAQTNGLLQMLRTPT